MTPNNKYRERAESLRMMENARNRADIPVFEQFKGIPPIQLKAVECMYWQCVASSGVLTDEINALEKQLKEKQEELIQTLVARDNIEDMLHTLGWWVSSERQKGT